MKLFQKQTQTFTIIWFVTKAIEQCTEDTTFFWILLFNKLKVCGNLASISVTFPTAFAHFVSLCYILVIVIIFHTVFIIVIFIMVICDPACYYCKKIMTR